MQTWNININLKVADSWIADGFDAAERIEQIKELLTELLPYAYDHELIITPTIKTAPKKDKINELQGY